MAEHAPLPVAGRAAWLLTSCSSSCASRRAWPSCARAPACLHAALQIVATINCVDVSQVLFLSGAWGRVLDRQPSGSTTACCAAAACTQCAAVQARQPLRTDEVDDGLVVRVGVHDSDAGVERICNLRHAGGGTGSTSPPFAHAHIGAHRRTCPSECRAVRWVGWAQTAGRAGGTAICTRNHTALSTYTADPMSEGMMIACRN